MTLGFTTEATFENLEAAYDRLKGRDLFQVVRSANLSQTALWT
jgi:hypothetical protein